MVEGIRESADAVRRDLRTFGTAGILNDESLRRLQAFRNRCADIGAGLMAARLDRLATLPGEELLARHAELAETTGDELDATVEALTRRVSARDHAGV
jgi:hypothetical protein